MVLYFIRLLLRYAALLVILPVLLAAIVFYLTRNEPKVYNSSTTVYTGIATGSSIVSLQESRVDLFGTRTAFDNLIRVVNSRVTAQEVGLQLFTSHMILDKAVPEIISEEEFEKLMKKVPEEVKALVVKGNFEATYRNFVNYKNANHNNYIYRLINRNNDPHYSSGKILSKLRVSRVQTSDMIELHYRSDDPGICQNTLKLFNIIFVDFHASISINQSDAVLRYFEAQLQIAVDSLKNAEDELLNFNKEHNIINYYEQTKHIASEREHFNLAHGRLQMDSASAYAVSIALEERMTPKEKTIINSNEIISLRNRLTDINLRISMKSYQPIDGQVRKDSIIEEIGELRIAAFNLEEELKNKIAEQYMLDHSSEGLSTSSVIDKWIEQIILLENTKARLAVAQLQSIEFFNLFTVYAPLGATMKRIERKIDVAERGYLSILHSLNLAKLKQQNLELNSNIKVVDPPYFPLEAQASKRKFLIIVAFMIGFVIPAFTIIALEFLDSNIKNVRRAEDMSGLKVAGLFPNLSNGKHKIDYSFVKTRCLDIMVRRLMINAKDHCSECKPILSAIFSTQAEEGKTLIIRFLAERLSGSGLRNLFVSPNECTPEGFDFVRYEPGPSFMNTHNLEELNADWSGIDFSNYDFVFLELPPIISDTYPIELIKKAQIKYIVTRANRAWGEYDTNAVNDIIVIDPDNPPQMLLNGVNIFEIENLLGDLPRKRSKIRKVIKNIVRLRFFSKNKFKTKMIE
jgi:succinoglycan biosynthesis transport protein ExoP